MRCAGFYSLLHTAEREDRLFFDTYCCFESMLTSMERINIMVEVGILQMARGDPGGLSVRVAWH